jgi:hypothetical protein
MICEMGAGGSWSAPVNDRSTWQMIVSFTTPADCPLGGRGTKISYNSSTGRAGILMSI